MQTSSVNSHPKGLYLIFATGMAERFSYYGMRAIFVLFIVKALLYDKDAASQLYGDYTGLVYLTPLLGGYVADRFWGINRSVFWGGIMMAIGQLLMFFSALYYTQSEFASTLMLAGLLFLVLGNGFFKPNITALVGGLYKPNDSRLDAAYTIFYMGVNVGAFFSPIICGTLGDTGDPADFKWGFLAAAIGMLLSVVLFEVCKKRYVTSPEGVPIGGRPERPAPQIQIEQVEQPAKSWAQKIKSSLLWLLLLAGLGLLFRVGLEFDWIATGIFSMCLFIPAYVISDPSLAKEEKQRIWVIYIMSFFVIFFWSAFEQAGASLTFFADEQTDRSLFGWNMPASYFQAFNPVFVVVLAPVMAWLWGRLGRRGLEPTSIGKQSIGLFLLALGYLIIAFGVRGVDPTTKVSILWLTGLYLIHSIGELALSPIGLSMVMKLSPVRFASLMMGIWYLSTATANKFAGMLSGLYPEPNVAKSFLGFPIVDMFDFFMLFVVMAAVASVILYLMSSRLQKMMNGVR